MLRLLAATLALSLASVGAAGAATTPKKGKATRSAPRAAAPPPPPPLAPADEAQQLAAAEVLQGDYVCEFKETIHIAADAQHPGWMQVRWRKDQYAMKPVLGRSGALRLEDATGRMLVVQIANKSMLMDAERGERKVDDCVHPVQRAANEQAKSAPPGPGLGIAEAATAAPK